MKLQKQQKSRLGWRQRALRPGTSADAKLGVRPFDPLQGCKENVKIDGLTGDPVGSNQMKKRKIWSQVQPGLKTNDDRVACWEGKVILTSAGPCTAKSVVGGEIK